MNRWACMILSIFFLALAAAPAGAAGEKRGASALDRFLGNQPQFFKLLPFNIPVIRDGRVVNQVSFIVSIETFGQANKEKIMAARYKLQNAFLQDLHGIVAIHHGNGRPMVARSVKIRLKRLAQQLLGGDVVKDVLIESAINMRVNR